MTGDASTSAMNEAKQHDIEHIPSSEDDEKHHPSKQDPNAGDATAPSPSHFSEGTIKSEPSLTLFDADLEKRLVRKIDLHIVPIVSILYLTCFLDRSNIGNARIAGLERDLHMNPQSYQFNILLTSFYIAYAAFEIPTTTLVKIVGPGRMIPIMAFLFGLFSFAMAFVTSFGQAVVVRFLLGVAESSALPGTAYYLSRWYKKDELVLRIGLYLVTAPSAGAFGGLLASGILKMGAMGDVKGWKMIFLVEGLMTMLVAIVAYFTLTDSISSARWLIEDEKRYLEARLRSEMVGQKELLDKTRHKLLWRGITSPTSLACAALSIFDSLAVQGIGAFLPTTIATFFPAPKHSVIQQQLLTVPPNLAGAVAILLFAYLSARFRNRSIFVICCAVLMVVGYGMFLGSKNLHVRYAASFFATSGCFSHGALLSTWAAANTNNDSERTGALAVTVFAGNIGGLVAPWSYLSKYKPDFVPGNALNCAGGAVMVCISVGLVGWQRWENRQREEGRRDWRLDGLSEEEVVLLGSDHPEFRLRY